MENNTGKHIIRFFYLVLLQVLIFNHINFAGFINPFPYIWFILLLPIDLPKWKVLIYSFLIGLSIDFFSGTGGMHAAACLVIALFRSNILRFTFGINYDFQNLKFDKTPFLKRLSYFIILTLIHHFVFFSMEYFDFGHIWSIFTDTLYHGIFTVIVLIILNLFHRKPKKV